MSTTIENGLAEAAGGLVDGAILTELLSRFQKHATDDRKAVELGTLVNATKESEARIIEGIANLIQKGILVRAGQVTVTPGCVLAITGISLTFGVSQGGLDFDAKQADGPTLAQAETRGKKKQAPESKLLTQPTRLTELEGERTVDGTEWRVSIKPVYGAETGPNSTVYVSCSLCCWERVEGEWTGRVGFDGDDDSGKQFSGPGCVVEAWLWVEEFIGWKPGLTDWLTEQKRGDQPVDLDPETFSALVDASLERDPDNAERQSLCRDGLERGEIQIGKGESGTLYRRLDIGGRRWPGLPAAENTVEPPADKPPKKPRAQKAKPK